MTDGVHANFHVAWRGAVQAIVSYYGSSAETRDLGARERILRVGKGTLNLKHAAARTAS